MPRSITSEQALKLMTENDRIMREYERQAAIVKEKAAAFDVLNTMRAVAISITRGGSVFVQDYRVEPSRTYSTETLAEAAARIAEDGV